MTYRLKEQRSDSGLLERILTYEEQAVQTLTQHVQAVFALPAIPGLSFQAGLRQTRSARVGPSTLIRLVELKKVPRYYLSTFELLVLRDGKPLTEACPGGFMSLFAAFVPLVCANRDEVLWYDYEADFPPALAELSRRLAGAFPDGRG